MSFRDETTQFTEIELKDAFFKFCLYMHKVLDESDPHLKKQKICHLSADSIIKYFESEKLTYDVYQKIKSLLSLHRNYYFLYLLDILLKNNKLFNKIVRKEIKDLETFFKQVWQRVWIEPKNSNKVECLKAMARTWAVIYGQRIQQNIKKWVESKYHTSLKLGDKNQQLIKQTYEKQQKQISPIKIQDKKLLKFLCD